jgi:hypothetical protein
MMMKSTSLNSAWPLLVVLESRPPPYLPQYVTIGVVVQQPLLYYLLGVVGDRWEESRYLPLPTRATYSYICTVRMYTV